MRSAAKPKSAAARSGNAIRTRIDVTSAFHVKIGMRNIVMPGARIVMIVVTKLTAPRIVPKPVSASPSTHRSPPTPGENVSLDNGVYAVHPKEAEPCGVRNPATAISEPKRNSQNENAFSRGNATSGAPICNGMTMFAKPANSGVANSSIMIVPCIVNIWLYCSRVCRISMPGWNSSARMMSASTPPSRRRRTTWPGRGTR